MTTTQLIQPPPPLPSVGHPRSAPSNPPPSEFTPSSLEERLDEVLPLIGVVPVAGPPVIVFVGAWALFVLMLTGPFLLLVTLLLVAVILVAISAAFLAPPFLFIRHLRRHRRRAPHRGRSGHPVRDGSQVGVALLAQRFNSGLVTGPAAQPRAVAHVHNRTHNDLTSE